MYPGMKARRKRNAGIELSCREAVYDFSKKRLKRLYRILKDLVWPLYRCFMRCYNQKDEAVL